MEHTSFNAFTDTATEIIILGTFPSVKSLEKQQYYGNKQNKFWKLLYDVFEEPLEVDYNKRLLFLKSKKIGLWDVFKSCERQGSLDSAIKNAVPNDLKSLAESHPNLKVFCFTSKQAHTWFYREYKSLLNIELIVLASPSPANARMTYLQKLADWKEKFKDIC